MNKFKAMCDQIVTEFIKQLQQEPTYLPDLGHPERFIDLGYDICQGDGSIGWCIKDALALKLKSYPPSVIEWLWWQIPSGRVREDYIYKAFASIPTDFSRLNLIDEDDEGRSHFNGPAYADDERFESIVNFFYEPVREIAENAFGRYDYYGFYDIECLDDVEFYESGGFMVEEILQPVTGASSEPKRQRLKRKVNLIEIDDELSEAGEKLAKVFREHKGEKHS